MKLKICPKTILLYLFIFIAILVSLNCTGYFLKYIVESPRINNFKLFNFDMEGNIPTYFSSLLLLSAGLLCGIIASCAKITKRPFFFHWMLLCAIFLYLSLDEMVMIHENLNRPLRQFFNLSGYLYFGSVVPGILIAAILLVSYLKFYFKLSRRSKVQFTLSFVIYTLGLVGMETIGGNYIESHGSENLVYGILTTIEETLEMIGISLFIYSFLDYIKNEIKKIEFEVNY